MIINVIYYDNGIKQKNVDSSDWLKAPNDILALTYEANGIKQECYSWGAYFVIDDFVGGFNSITGFNGNKKKYFPIETFLVDPRVKMGKELSNAQWDEVRKII